MNRRKFLTSAAALVGGFAVGLGAAKVIPPAAPALPSPDPENERLLAVVYLSSQEEWDYMRDVQDVPVSKELFNSAAYVAVCPRSGIARGDVPVYVCKHRWGDRPRTLEELLGAVRMAADGKLRWERKQDLFLCWGPREARPMVFYPQNLSRPFDAEGEARRQAQLGKQHGPEAAREVCEKHYRLRHLKSRAYGVDWARDFDRSSLVTFDPANSRIVEIIRLARDA